MIMLIIGGACYYLHLHKVVKVRQQILVNLDSCMTFVSEDKIDSAVFYYEKGCSIYEQTDYQSYLKDVNEVIESTKKIISEIENLDSIQTF